jgi:ribonuclease D
VTEPAKLVVAQEEFEALVDELSEADEIAVDTEFHRERSYWPQLALVQLAAPGHLLLIDPLAVDVSGLARVFSSGVVVVMHAADHDLELLERACGALPERLFDTQLAAGFIGFSSPSLLTLVESMLGVRLKKGNQLTDWMRRPLSSEQVSYAAADVAWLLDLKAAVSTRLAAVGRLDWAEQECALLLAKDRSGVVPEQAWWRMPRLRRLHGQSRGVAQEVAAWRERRAQKLDLPARFVLSDLALLSIVQRPPTSRQDLARSRGVDGRYLEGGAGEDLLAAVRRGAALRPSQLQLPPAVPAEAPSRPVVALATAYVGHRAAELGIDPAILATRADLAALFSNGAAASRGRLSSGWRAELLGTELEKLAKGEAALAFDGQDALLLEERSHRPVSRSPEPA